MGAVLFTAGFFRSSQRCTPSSDHLAGLTMGDTPNEQYWRGSEFKKHCLTAFSSEIGWDSEGLRIN